MRPLAPFKIQSPRLLLGRVLCLPPLSWKGRRSIFVVPQLPRDTAQLAPTEPSPGCAARPRRPRPYTNLTAPSFPAPPGLTSQGTLPPAPRGAHPAPRPVPGCLRCSPGAHRQARARACPPARSPPCPRPHPRPRQQNIAEDGEPGARGARHTRMPGYGGAAASAWGSRGGGRAGGRGAAGGGGRLQGGRRPDLAARGARAVAGLARRRAPELEEAAAQPARLPGCQPAVLVSARAGWGRPRGQVTLGHAWPDVAWLGGGELGAAAVEVTAWSPLAWSPV